MASEMSVNEIKWIQSANGAVWFIDLIHECNEWVAAAFFAHSMNFT